jgi:K+-sensing histidine kinase KdpD
MTRSIEKLTALGEGMMTRGEQASMELLTGFLDQLTHDLNNPLGTFGLELFSLGTVGERLTRALASSDLAEVAKQIKTLEAVCANLVGASQTAARLLEAVDAQSTAWTELVRPTTAQEQR